MKIIYRDTNKVLKEIDDFDSSNEELIKELVDSFDGKPILKYELTFNEGLGFTVGDLHDFNNVKPKFVSSITITIA
jgi:hypothetical protein